MALPGNQLSSSTSNAPFEFPRDVWKVATNDFEMGADALADPSAGFASKMWTARINDAATQILLSAPGVSETVQITDTDITEVSLTFDQQMRPFIAYVANGAAKYRWFDPLIPGFTTTTMVAGVTNPRCCLDDKRPLGLPNSDIILAYMRADSLRMRMQRDRYAIEYTLTSVPGFELVQIGMNRGGRFQFQVRP